MSISISSRNITFVLLSIIVFLALAYVGTWYVYTEYHRYDRIFRVFDLDSEGNIPSLFSAFLLFSGSLLFGIIASIEKSLNQKLYYYWVWLCVIFFYLFLDEGAGLHECLRNPAIKLLNFFGVNASGILYAAWFVYYIIFLFIFILVFSKFLFRINSRLRYLMILSGLVYVSGAIGFEMINGIRFEFLGLSNDHYILYQVILEEMFEMIGIVILIYSLMDYIAVTHCKYEFTLFFNK